MELIVQFKFVWGLIFTAAILLYTTINMILGKTAMEYIVVWQLVAVTIFLTFIYYLIFGEYILRNSSTMLKVFIHFSISYTILLISGLSANLIDISKLNHYVIFTIGYVILYLSIIFSLYAYYRLTGEELNKRLAVYKQNKGID
jgi:hypothetical protein